MQSLAQQDARTGMGATHSLAQQVSRIQGLAQELHTHLHSRTGMEATHSLAQQVSRMQGLAWELRTHLHSR